MSNLRDAYCSNIEVLYKNVAYKPTVSIAPEGPVMDTFMPLLSTQPFTSANKFSLTYISQKPL